MTHTDHVAYIDSVRQALTDHDIDVAEVSVTAKPIRSARIRLDPESTEAVFPQSSHVDLTWDEEYGWQCLPHYAAHTGLGDSAIGLGYGLVPDPGKVARWTESVVIDRDPPLSRDHDDPYRDAAAVDPDFERQLAAYSHGNTR